LQGNLCRCTGYEAIVRAARAIFSYGKAAKDPLAAERKAIAEKLAAMKDGSRIEIGAGKQRLVVPANAD
ncbi:MAG: xanthine dehydrogenase small subunit, partial [Mesorhizobium sp.]